jgi:hypothetical protein
LRAIDVLNTTKKEIILHITFIQSQWGVLPKNLLSYLGYTKAIIGKIPTMFNRDGQNKFFSRLATIKMGNKSIVVTLFSMPQFLMIF